MQQRISDPHMEIHSLRIHHYAPRFLQNLNNEDNVSRRQVRQMGLTVIMWSLGIVCIGQIIVPLTIVAIVPQADFLRPLVILFGLNIVAVFSSIILSVTYYFLLQWMKGLSDAYNIVQSFRRALYVNIGGVLCVTIVLLLSISSYPNTYWNWSGGTQGFLVSLTLTLNLYIIYGAPILRGRRKTGANRPPLDSSNTATLTAKRKHGRLIYSRSIVAVKSEFKTIMSTPLFFEDYKSFACDRYAGESFQFLEILSKWQPNSFSAQLRGEGPILQPSVLASSNVQQDSDMQFSMLEAAEMKREIEVFIRPDQAKTLNLTSGTCEEATQYLDNGKYDRHLHGLMNAKREITGLIFDNFFQDYCSERNGARSASLDGIKLSQLSLCGGQAKHNR